MNIADILTEHARSRADHPAIEDGARVVTYGELDRLVNAAAASLHEAGLGQGDFVALSLPNSIEHIVILAALARIGAASLSMDERLPSRERERIVEGLEIKASTLR